MKSNKFMPLTVIAAAAIALNAVPIWAQSVGGGTPSQRSRESDNPVPPGDKAGTDPGSAGQSPGGKGQSGSPSQRSRESDNPIPPGDKVGTEQPPIGSGRSSLPQGSRDPSKVGQGSRNVSPTHAMGGQQGIRQAQEALKNQGHDPGPIDGVLGPQTRQALKTFQSSNGLKQSGMLDAETKQKLNIDNSTSQRTGTTGR
jgi:hypothetical protein